MAVFTCALLWVAMGCGAAAQQSRPGCSGPDVAVDANFDQAGYASCFVGPDGSVTLRIRPETKPINPSPWYAARLTQTVHAARRVDLTYEGERHRYQPWFSADGESWQPLNTVVLDAAGSSVSVTLPAFSGSAFLSAQPLVPLGNISDRWSQLAAAGRVVEVAGGTSVEGRAVSLFRAGRANARRLHVIATRQHPPETGGAAAFDVFAAHVLDQFESRSCTDDAILFAPILNPDGIVRGHWRTNGALVDLNRDWGRFTQPETRALGMAMQHQARTGTIASVLDFHSTRTGAIYVPRSAGSTASTFAAAVAQHAGLKVIKTRSAEGNTLKSWAETSFGSASFTVELPDAASPDQAALAGRAIAEQFALHYLCDYSGEPR